MTSFALTDLVTYAGIPILTGGIASLADHHIGNGIVVGSVAGLSYVAMDALRLTRVSHKVYPFSSF